MTLIVGYTATLPILVELGARIARRGPGLVKRGRADDDATTAYSYE